MRNLVEVKDAKNPSNLKRLLGRKGVKIPEKRPLTPKKRPI